MIDGPKLVLEALAAELPGLVIYAEPDAPDDVVLAAERHGVDVVGVQSGALAKVTSPVTPQATAAIAAIPDAPDLATVRGLVLVLVEVADPGNVGTLLRVAEASGASAVVCCGDGADIWNPKVVRASAGASFRVPILDGGDVEGCVRSLGDRGMTTLATVLDGGRTIDDVDLSGDLAVLLGNEAHGLAPDVVAGAADRVTIPMAGRVESLNVAMAGTVIAFEAARQRRARAKGTASST